ncbi:MAG: hypothetical protein EA350_00385 [Gemmatimonadales bacterium]|nr:MAG: hypothetical protein EA350_00385 [Gemmatimonadales bacterium]
MDVPVESTDDRVGEGNLERWPVPLRARARTVLLLVAGLVALAWAAVVWIDLLGMVERGDRFKPVWVHLFNDRPVEWIQWFILPATTVGAAYLAARLHHLEEQRPASFFFLLAIATALMLIEDAGDIRHVISDYVVQFHGDRVLGLPTRVATDVPYFALLAAVPLYALIRYGRDAWRAPGARPYLVTGFGLYALAGASSGIRHLGDLYVRLGAFIDARIMGGRFPVPEGMDPDRAHFFLVDSLLEESVESLAAACFLGIVLAFATDVRARRLESAR